MRASDLYVADNALAPHYQAFDVANRLLLTGHSHQAWPDVARQGQLEAFDDAALHVDDKWERAFAKARQVAAGYAHRLSDLEGSITLGSSTHELLVRLLSALPLKDRPRVVTTDGEYHSVRRQLDRLVEEGLQLVRVKAEPAETLAERMALQVDDKTSLVVVSYVMFRTSLITPHLSHLASVCRFRGAALLVDVYHALNVVPLSLKKEDLGDAFVVGGGYKYMQLGEGNAFLRLPPGCNLRPAITGWYAEMHDISASTIPGAVSYSSGALRFAGATYDPSSQYRAARVLEFFDEQGMTPEFLREVSQHQVGLLATAFDHHDLQPALISRDRSRPLTAFGGFLALFSRGAGEIAARLKARGVQTDHRGDVLRLGPAPYLSDSQLERAMNALAEIVRTPG